MLTSTSTADDAPGASIVAVVISFLDDKDDEDEEGPSQLALALGKENNVITMRSSGLQEPDPGCHLTAVDGRVMCDVMPIDDAVWKLGCGWGK